MTYADVTGVLILFVSVLVLGLAVAHVIRQARKQRGMVAARHKQLQEMLVYIDKASAGLRAGLPAEYAALV